MARYVERLLDVILSLDYKDLLDEYGEPVIPSNKIYTKISTALKNDITPKYIYMMIKYRYGIKDKIQKFHNINISDSTLLESSTSSLDTSTRDKTLEFNVTFSYKDWIGMSPEDVLYFDKKQSSHNYCMLRRKIWTDKIYKSIYKYIFIKR